ncbi:MAG: hypothetical protein IKM61_07955 [Eubacteriaceae bacterium]|nr:hypothetical protein [Eubacteriaceae bacterium]
MEKINYVLDDRNITIYKNYDEGDVIYLCESHSDDEMMEKISARLKKLTGKTPWSFVIFDVKDWNNDLSPWKGRNSKDEDVFGGNGSKTLEWIKDRLIPFVEGEDKYSHRYISGYSLAGLFALWAFYETDLFDGVGSCSGSVWFDGWDEYMKCASANKPSKVYLSLGMKEEKTKDKLMATVGDRTRMQYEMAENDPSVEEKILVMNPGGHFTEPENRIASAVAWLVKGV